MTVENFKRQAKLKEITFWENHKCGICRIPVGIEIDYFNETVSYKSSCGCAYSQNRPMDWEELVDRYERILNCKNEELIKKTNEFWGFI